MGYGCIEVTPFLPFGLLILAGLIGGLGFVAGYAKCMTDYTKLERQKS